MALVANRHIKGSWGNLLLGVPRPLDWGVVGSGVDGSSRRKLSNKRNRPVTLVLFMASRFSGKSSSRRMVKLWAWKQSRMRRETSSWSLFESSLAQVILRNV